MQMLLIVFQYVPNFHAFYVRIFNFSLSLTQYCAHGESKIKTQIPGLRYCRSNVSKTVTKLKTDNERKQVSETIAISCNLFCMYVCMYVCVGVWASVCGCVCFSLSLYLSIYQSIYLSLSL